MKRTVIDLFCGAGGLSEGFRQAGYHVLAGNDVDTAAGQTFEATHDDASFIGAPIQSLSPNDFLSSSGLSAGDLDVLVGGPPCQAYSVYNHQRGLHDDRASLFKEYLRIVSGLRPKWIVIENVTGITSIANGEVVRTILNELNKLGYRADYQILKAEQFGVPQERRRLFIIANRVDLPIAFPLPTFGPDLAPFTTVWDAISDLPSISNGEDASGTTYQTPPQGWFQLYARGNSLTAENHAAPRLGRINIERMAHIPQGGSWRDIPKQLLPEGMKRANRSDHTKRYGRMRPNGLASTILTKCDVHWGAFIHPTQERAISVREAARLQSFPDNFLFLGSKTEQYVQVGNAVPPLLGRCIGEAILAVHENKMTPCSSLPLSAAE